jgi:hypothetical protein
VTDLQQDGGSAIYALFNNRCTELFRVIYNGRAYRGNGVRPQGVITAYYRTGVGPAIAADSTDSADSTLGADGAALTTRYRTDCEVIQEI